jgi:uncharacterized membrane protein YjgN (DUF898 family)
MKKWFYTLKGQQAGPVTEEELRHLQASGTIDGLSLVWCEGMSDWMSLNSVPEHLLAPAGSSGTVALEAPPSPLLASAPAGSEQTHRFEFHGKAGEYFRIWIVNVVLTVLTLGIYAAWAKVRTLRYFYGNTRLDGKPFDFTGNPISMLKGNLIFGALFIVYVVSSSLLPALALVVILFIMVLSPWLIQKALRFRAHNTLHRNVRFNFRGTVGESYTVFLWMNLLIIFTLGLIVPYIQFLQKKFYLGNMGWGNCLANMNGRAGYFYKTFFKSIGLLFLIPLLASVIIPVVAMMNKDADPEEQSISQVQSDASEQAQAEAGATVEDSQDQADKERQEFENVLKEKAELGESIAVLFILPFYLLMFLAITFYNVRTANYSVNATQWGGLGRLESSVRVRDMLWLYFSNTLAVVLTLGLLIPWVKVRMAAYRASKTTFIAAGSLDAVAQSLGTGDSALGDAGADIFDFDIGF